MTHFEFFNYDPGTEELFIRKTFPVIGFKIIYLFFYFKMSVIRVRS